MIRTIVLVSHNYVCVLLYIIIYKVIYCTLTLYTYAGTQMKSDISTQDCTGQLLTRHHVHLSRSVPLAVYYTIDSVIWQCD